MNPFLSLSLSPSLSPVSICHLCVSVSDTLSVCVSLSYTPPSPSPCDRAAAHAAKLSMGFTESIREYLTLRWEEARAILTLDRYVAPVLPSLSPSPTLPTPFPQDDDV